MKSIQRAFLLATLTGRLFLIGWQCWQWLRPVLPYWRTFNQVRPTLIQTWQEVRGIQQVVKTTNTESPVTTQK